MAQFNTCPHCGDNLDHGEACDCQKGTSEPEAVHRPRRMPCCRDCGRKFIEIDAYVEEAVKRGLDMREFLRGDPCYNPEAELFLCPDCWEAAGQPMEMVQPKECDPRLDPDSPDFDPDATVEPITGSGLIVRPNLSSKVLNAPAGDDEEDVPQADDMLYTCKYCGQSSFTPGCICDGAEAEQRREAAERGRENARQLIAEILFARFLESDDDGYKSDPVYKMLASVVDAVIDNRIAKASIGLDYESKLNISVKEFQVQVELTRTLKTAKTASVV